ncbi:MAG: DUF1415 domain-containing protein [Cocleimonas sp.]
MTNKTLIIKQTQKWLSSVIIEHSICPFAKREHDNDRIHYEVIESKSLEAQLEQLILQCEALDNDASRETSLLIFPNTLSDFEGYLDVVEISNELMTKQGYEGIYQLASFHPQYRFADSPIDDASNYTNRSPYPMLHILREESIEKVLANYPKPEDIPERNIKLTQDLGLKEMKRLLSDCY